jgi:hypothetical protein
MRATLPVQLVMVVALTIGVDNHSVYARGGGGGGGRGGGGRR